MGDPFSIYNSKYPEKKYPHSLDWEESLGETDDPEDYYEGHGRRSNIKLFAAAVLVIFASLALRLANLQLWHGSFYKKQAQGNYIRIQPILAPRGIIFDSQNKPMVQNVPSFELVATPFDLPRDSNLWPEEFAKLYSFLDSAKAPNFDVVALIDQLKSVKSNSIQAVSVVSSLPHDVAVAFEAHSKELPGFSIQNNPIRKYLDPIVFSHLLGYTGKINESELTEHKNQGYLISDSIGKYGIEYSYEPYLRGQSGQRRIEADAIGNIISVLGEIPTKPGQNLVLNIDAELQRALYKQIVAKNGNRKAAAVAMDPRNGKILALVSLPGFDSNLFSAGISQSDYQTLLDNPDRPLFNRAISGIYPPGSTIKPVMASAALQEDIVNENTKIVDNGDLVVGNFHFRGWKPGGLGPMDLRSAIAWSSDIYFYTVGGGQQKLGISGLGPERIEKYAYLFGMGQKLGIDLQGENTGIIASPQWRKSHFKEAAKQEWYLGDTYHASIGQGDMAVTPLQVCEWTAAVANSGNIYKPYVVDRVLDSSGKTLMQNSPTLIRSGFIDKKKIEIVREGMRKTVLSGTAKLLQSLPISSAGKTGTAQFDAADPKATHAWFTAFAPFEEPQIAVTVMIEAGGEGSSASAPVVKNVLQWWAEHRYNRSIHESATDL